MRLKTETPADLDAISKWLDIAGNKLDYRRYGEVIIKAIALSLSYLSLSYPDSFAGAPGDLDRRRAARPRRQHTARWRQGAGLHQRLYLSGRILNWTTRLLTFCLVFYIIHPQTAGR